MVLGLGERKEKEWKGWAVEMAWLRAGNANRKEVIT